MNYELVHERRLRRLAARQGLLLMKSRTRMSSRADYGSYQLVDSTTGGLVAWGLHGGYGLSLGEIESALLGKDK